MLKLIFFLIFLCTVEGLLFPFIKKPQKQHRSTGRGYTVPIFFCRVGFSGFKCPAMVHSHIFFLYCLSIKAHSCMLLRERVFCFLACMMVKWTAKYFIPTKGTPCSRAAVALVDRNCAGIKLALLFLPTSILKSIGWFDWPYSWKGWNNLDRFHCHATKN